MGVSKNTGRKTISDAQLKSEIVKQFNAGKTGKTDLYGILRTKFKLGKDRYFNLYNTTHAEWASLKGQAESEALVQETKEAAKSGLKSKIEKQLHLQKQIDDIQADLNSGISPDYVIIDGKVQKVNKVMKPESKAFLRKTIKDLYAELNKMEGDYAPTKVAQTDTKGNDIPILKFVPASTLQPEEIEALNSNEGN